MVSQCFVRASQQEISNLWHIKAAHSNVFGILHNCVPKILITIAVCVHTQSLTHTLTHNEDTRVDRYMSRDKIRQDILELNSKKEAVAVLYFRCYSLFTLLQ